MRRKDLLTDNILSLFRGLPTIIFTEQELYDFLINNIAHENAYAYNSIEKMIGELVSKKIIEKATITTPQSNNIDYYIKGMPSIYEIAVVLKPKAYISHESAAYLHNLTKGKSSAIYATWEQSPKERKDIFLAQEAVDNSFNKEQKKSEAKYKYENYTIILLNGMFTGREGVQQQTEKNNFAITGIERTLIDATVRPAYAGGALKVLEMYKKAITKISLEELMGILNTIPFVYPYHQSVGFYLEKAGYNGPEMKQLIKKEKQIDFYLDYAMKDKSYSPDWRIYYPSEMND